MASNSRMDDLLLLQKNVLSLMAKTAADLKAPLLPLKKQVSLRKHYLFLVHQAMTINSQIEHELDELRTRVEGQLESI